MSPPGRNIHGGRNGGKRRTGRKNEGRFDGRNRIFEKTESRLIRPACAEYIIK